MKLRLINAELMPAIQIGFRPKSTTLQDYHQSLNRSKEYTLALRKFLDETKDYDDDDYTPEVTKVIDDMKVEFLMKSQFYKSISKICKVNKLYPDWNTGGYYWVDILGDQTTDKVSKLIDFICKNSEFKSVSINTYNNSFNQY